MNAESGFSTLLVLVGGIFIIAGLITYIFPPKKINYFYGYRTKSSMKSIERWRFAQRYSSILMAKYGLLIIAISSIGKVFSISEKVDFCIGMVFLLFPAMMLFIQTEKAIKDRFPND